VNSTLMTDLALAPLAGYVGTKVMEPVSSKLYELESEQDRRREDEARPGMPYAIAARKTADLLGLNLTDKQHELLALALRPGDPVGAAVPAPAPQGGAAPGPPALPQERQCRW
jgi:hypothetical protein